MFGRQVVTLPEPGAGIAVLEQQHEGIVRVDVEQADRSGSVPPGECHGFVLGLAVRQGQLEDGIATVGQPHGHDVRDAPAGVRLAGTQVPALDRSCEPARDGRTPVPLGRPHARMIPTAGP